MATMYALFLGVLLAAVCSPVGIGGGTVNEIKEKGSSLPAVAGNKDSKFHDGVIEKSNLTATEKLEYQYEENPIGPEMFWTLHSRSGQKICRTRMSQRAMASAKSRLQIRQAVWSLPALQGLGRSGHEDEKPCAKETKEGREVLDSMGRSLHYGRDDVDVGGEVPIIRQMPDLLRHDVVRDRVVQIATAELGVREATGRNDGPRVEEYLRYTSLGKGHAWCAAFVSWCFGQAGLPQPRNPWSPALFPNSRTYRKQSTASSPLFGRGGGGEDIKPADLFAIYSASVKRINHVGLVKSQKEHWRTSADAYPDKYIVTIEGNSNNRVESRRRHLSTIYALADWIGKMN